MLILALVFMFFVAMLVTFACGFGCVIMAEQRLQATTNEIALSGTMLLNQQDRIGQLNNMTARSRQLIFTAEKVVDDIEDIDPELKPITEYLFDEAKEGATILDEERKTVNDKMRIAAKALIVSHFDKAKPAHRSVTPFFQTTVPEIESVDFGYIKDVESNVGVFKGVEELQQYDESNAVWESHNVLHKANNNAKLPGNSQDFFLSSLAAPVDGEVAPARIALVSAYKKLDAGSKYLPSAIRLVTKMKIKAPFSEGTENTVKVTSVTTATGGQVFN